MGKIGNMIHAYVNITSLKTLTRNLVSKTCERKEYNMILVHVNIQEMSSPDSCKFRRRRIPILYRNFINIEVGKDLVNSSARLSHAVICKMFISSLSCNLWGIKQLRGNVLSDITLYVTCLHLCNISEIIFIDNCR